MAKLKGGTRIYGDIKIDGGIYDSSNQVGVGGSVLISTGVGIAWTSAAGAGAQGAQGAQGFQGTVGAQGAQGSQGFQGTIGAQGAQGSQGFQGTIGAQGAQGAQGFQGTVGTQGAQGFQGAVGAQGAQGSQGFQGSVGAQGAQGSQGFQGAQGNFTIYNQSTAPVSPNIGDYWVDTSDGTTYVYYNDGNSSQWVEFGPTPQEYLNTGVNVYDGSFVGFASAIDFGANFTVSSVSAGIVTITASGGSGTIGIATAGGTVGTGVTLLDFRGSGISTVTVSSGIGTINIQSGGTATPDISPVMMGMIF